MRLRVVVKTRERIAVRAVRFTRLLVIGVLSIGVNGLPQLSADDSLLAIPSRWKSLTSGTTKTVRISDDHVYVESEVRPEQKAYGAFKLADLKKDSDGSYRGILRDREFGQYVTGLEAWVTGTNAALGNKQPPPVHVQGCTFEFGVEITLLTPTRIEGRVQDFAPKTKFDVKKCKANKEPVWTFFTWIPE